MSGAQDDAHGPFLRSGGGREKRRVHFHAFMAEVHERLHQARREANGGSDPVSRVAAEFSRETRLLCFDEFAVSDIADATILARLFSRCSPPASSSSQPPTPRPSSSADGRDRGLFQPFIALLQEHIEVVRLDARADSAPRAAFPAAHPPPPLRTLLPRLRHPSALPSSFLLPPPPHDAILIDLAPALLLGRSPSNRPFARRRRRALRESLDARRATSVLLVGDVILFARRLQARPARKNHHAGTGRSRPPALLRVARRRVCGDKREDAQALAGESPSLQTEKTPCPELPRD